MRTKRSGIIFLIFTMVLVFSQLPVFAEDETPVLTINGSGVGTELTLSIADLMAMPAEAQIEDEYIYTTRYGDKTAAVKGVSLSYILKEVAMLNIADGSLTMTASDGYPIDPQSLTDVLNDDLQYAVVYEVDGAVLDDDDNPATSEVRIYRKQKEAGEFGTLFKLVANISVGEAVVEEATVEETTEATTEETTEATTEVVESAETDAFPDVIGNYGYANKAVNELAARKIVSGNSDGLFHPEQEITRAEFCEMVVMGLGAELKDYAGAFSDVDASEWYAPYVQTAYELGLFAGYGDGTFRPDGIITRQEMAVVTAKGQVALEKVTQEKVNKFVMEKSAYADKDGVASWAANAVAWLEAQGTFTEMTADQFMAGNAVHRGEAAMVIYKAFLQ